MICTYFYARASDKQRFYFFPPFLIFFFEVIRHYDTVLERETRSERTASFAGTLWQTGAGFPGDFSGGRLKHRVCFVAAFVGAGNERASARSARIFNDEYRGAQVVSRSTKPVTTLAAFRFDLERAAPRRALSTVNFSLFLGDEGPALSRSLTRDH